MEDFSEQAQSGSDLTFQNFVAGECNSAALAATREVSESPGIKYNPLYIYCGVGQGKSHLLQALGWDFKRRNPNSAVLLVNGEEFSEEFGQAADKQAFRERYSQPALLLIDDFHLLSETARTEILRIFETLQSRKKQLVLTSLRNPQRMTMDERLKSRIEGGLVCKILPPDLNTRIGILKLRAKKAGVSISQNVLEEIAGRVILNVRKLEGAINRLAVLSKAKGEEISVEFVESALRDMIPEFPSEGAAAYKEPVEGGQEEFGDFVLEVAKTMSVIRQEPSEEARMREAYAEKLYVWEMKGFNVGRLKAAMDKKMDVVAREFITFTSNVQRLIELQNRYGALNAKRFPDEQAEIEELLFNPDALEEVTRRINWLESRVSATSLDLIEDYTFERFSVDSPNQEAHKLCRSVAESPWTCPDVIFLWGGQGTGKSHLISAVARELYTKRSNINVFLLHGEIFVDDLKMERGRHTRGKLRARCLEADLLLADDVQAIFENQISANEFMAILEQRVEQKKKMILVSDLPPEKTYIDPGFMRLMSKGVVHEIGAPTEKLKQAIAWDYLLRKEVKVSQGEIEEVCAGVKDNLWELMDRLDQVVGGRRGETALVEGTPVVEDRSAYRPVVEKAKVKPPVEEAEEVAAPPLEEQKLDQVLEERPAETIPVEGTPTTMDRSAYEPEPEKAEPEPSAEEAEETPGPDLLVEEKLSEIHPGEGAPAEEAEVKPFVEEAEGAPAPSLAEPGLDLVVKEKFSKIHVDEGTPAEEDTSAPRPAAEEVEPSVDEAEEVAAPPAEEPDLEKVLEERFGETVAPEGAPVEEDRSAYETVPGMAEEVVAPPLMEGEEREPEAEPVAEAEVPPKEVKEGHPSEHGRAEEMMDAEWDVDEERLIEGP